MIGVRMAPRHGNHEVENWFELMDAWFDVEKEGARGGSNGVCVVGKGIILHFDVNFATALARLHCETLTLGDSSEQRRVELTP